MAGGERQVTLYGPKGEVIGEELRSGFNDHSEPVLITPQQELIGRKTFDIYAGKLHRQFRWLIKEGKIAVRKASSLEQQVEHGEEVPDLQDIDTGIIITDGLEKEQISSTLAAVVLDFKRVEDKLSDFTGRGSQEFRNYWGIQRSHLQWGHEEGQHSDADGLIVEATGHATHQELADDYYRNLHQTWEQPFPTVREVIAYTVLQELMTSHTYHALAREAMKQGAPTVAQVLRLIATDEAYHYGGYKEFLWVFAEQDLAGTITDTIHVAENFRMPAQNLLPDPKRSLMNAVRVGAFSKELVSEDTLYKGLKALRFIPEPLARQTANNYWKKQS